VVQPFVQLGKNIILWSGNHIGHHSIIDDHCFISSHVIISGYTKVGKHCFLGVNSTIINDVKISEDCWIGPGVTIAKDTEPGQFYKLHRAEPAKLSTYEFFNIKKF
jgi:UDP-3-O-[3-hydroxymyristoyl] glucosamine N-acyltransferase